MTIDLLNTEAFSNMAFDQMHNAYMLMREERRKTLEKVKNEAIEQIKNKLMEELHWWLVRDFEGVQLGYGYGTAKGVCNLFVNHDYKDRYDELWVKMLPVKAATLKQFAKTECKYNVAINMEYDWNIEEFKQLEEELKKKGLVLPEVR